MFIFRDLCAVLVIFSNVFVFVFTESTIDSSTIDRFSIEPTEGYLEAHITHVSDSKSLLKVYFTAKLVYFLSDYINFSGFFVFSK